MSVRTVAGVVMVVVLVMPVAAETPLFVVVHSAQMHVPVQAQC